MQAAFLGKLGAEWEELKVVDTVMYALIKESYPDIALACI